jgi:hypothetical protein
VHQGQRWRGIKDHPFDFGFDLMPILKNLLIHAHSQLKAMNTFTDMPA